jgi:hypothetical protein
MTAAECADLARATPPAPGEISRHILGSESRVTLFVITTSGVLRWETNDRCWLPAMATPEQIRQRVAVQWGCRTAQQAGVNYARLVVENDGFVYAMPEDPADGAIAWWPLPDSMRAVVEQTEPNT